MQEKGERQTQTELTNWLLGIGATSYKEELNNIDNVISA